ncbi:MAG TPA: transposase family protein [Candidatus Sulfopaludibacter sp.]|nr:transposase family protein [Candidatus Sulfopaludibacter sp.]
MGVEKDFPSKLSALPSKRKRNQQDLSQEEIDYNRIHAKKRIVIEHTICQFKKYRIMSYIFRNKLRKYNRI